MPILDHRGNPVQLEKLEKEIATPTLGGVRQIFYESVASGLTPALLADVLKAVDGGDPTNYLTLAEEMEEREFHYSSVLSTRKRAIEKLKVHVEAPTDETKDVEAADFVREVVKQGSFRKLVAQQMDGLGKGFSVSEILWDRSGSLWEPMEYKWRDPRYFTFARKDQETLRLRDMHHQIEGIPLEAYKFIVHKPQLKMGLTIRGGLARLAAVAYMAKGYTLKDWLAFIEVFGMPLRVGKYGTSATPDQKAKLLTAVSNIGSDAACIIPEGMVIEILQNKSQSSDPVFQGLADWLDKQVSKAVLGQTMTTDDGSSLSQARVHNEVREDIMESDAFQLASTLNQDLVKPLVDLNFGERDRRRYPVLTLVEEHAEDLKLLSEALPPFIDRGLPVEISTILDKFGLPLPEDDARVLRQEGTAPEPSDEVFVDQALNRDSQERRLVFMGLLRRVGQGESLSADERVLLAALAQLEEPEEDRVAREVVEGDLSFMEPVLQPVLDLIEGATSFEEVEARLEGLKDKIQVADLVKQLALATFKARGLGDTTDQVTVPDRS